MTEGKIYPVSEIFSSPQGEGLYSGTMMTFIRLGGCTVGKPYPKEMHQPRQIEICHERDSSMDYVKEVPGLPIYTERCTLYDGRTFPCDTDYRIKERLNVEQIIERLPKDIKHVCITGGEPLMHDISELVNKLIANSFLVHLETSGTILYKGTNLIWITVSPKYGCLASMVNRADEIKLLVDDKFDIEQVPHEVKKHGLVFIHPVNYEHSVNPDNVRRIMELQKQFPHWRVGLQLHKVLEHYIQQHVR